MDEARWFNTSVETLVETNPDWIIINDYGAQTVDEKKEFLDTNPALSEIPAVKIKVSCDSAGGSNAGCTGCQSLPYIC